MTTVPAPIPVSSNNNNSIQDPPISPPEIPIPDHIVVDDDFAKEFDDEPSIVNAKIDEFVLYIQQSKYTVVYTGAGISTNTNRLQDFRGDKGLTKDGNRPPMVVMGMAETKMDSIMPTFTHHCLQLLTDANLIHMIVTSNHDGLHDKSGIQPNEQIEIFGNVFVEKCRKCKTRFYRHSIVSHLYRKCEQCKGKLKRTACNMGEMVDKVMISRAEAAAKLSDFALVLGSSMTVYPFCDLPLTTMKKVGYVLVTRQKTQFDEHALLCIHVNVDEFMFKVMHKLWLLDLLPNLKSNPLLFNHYSYEQTFDCKFGMDEQNDEMLKIQLQSRFVNEGLPFIESASLVINSNAIANEESKSDIIGEYEFQQKRDLNWGLGIFRKQFFKVCDNIGSESLKIQIIINWDQGFNIKPLDLLWNDFNWNSNVNEYNLQTIECQLRKTLVYDVPALPSD